jgi:hypothetical protein
MQWISCSRSCCVGGGVGVGGGGAVLTHSTACCCSCSVCWLPRSRLAFRSLDVAASIRCTPARMLYVSSLAPCTRTTGLAPDDAGRAWHAQLACWPCCAYSTCGPCCACCTCCASCTCCACCTCCTSCTCCACCICFNCCTCCASCGLYAVEGEALKQHLQACLYRAH